MSMQTKLSTLWLFVTLNTIYCDVTSFQDSHVLKQYLAGNVGGVLNVRAGGALGAQLVDAHRCVRTSSVVESVSGQYGGTDPRC